MLGKQGWPQGPLHTDLAETGAKGTRAQKGRGALFPTCPVDRRLRSCFSHFDFSWAVVAIHPLTPHPGPYLEDTKHGPHTRESLHSLIQGALLLPRHHLHTQGNGLDQGDKHLDEVVCLWGKIVR